LKREDAKICVGQVAFVLIVVNMEYLQMYAKKYASETSLPVAIIYSDYVY
jgi:hypothetical protein